MKPDADTPYGNITWILCVPDPTHPHRLIPYVHRKTGGVWFSELQYIDRFLRENRDLPAGAKSAAIVGVDRLLRLSLDLLRGGVDTLYLDLEHGKESPGRSLAEYAIQLHATFKRDTAAPSAG